MVRVEAINAVLLTFILSFSILVSTESQVYFRILFALFLIFFIYANYDISFEINNYNLYSISMFLLYVDFMYISYFLLLWNGEVSFSPKSAIGPAISLLIFTIAFLIIPSYLYRNHSPVTLLKYICAFGGIFCLASLAFEYLSGITLVFGVPQLQGFLYNTNSFGVVVSFFTCAAFILAVFKRSLFFYAIFGIFFIFLLCSFTRSRLLSVFISCFLVFLMHRGVTVRSMLLFCLSALMAGVVAIYLGDYLLTLATQEGKTFTRFYVWMSAIKAIKASPWLGYSMDYLELGLIADFQRELLGIEKIGVGMHNTHLHLLLQGGFIGFAFYCLAVFPIFLAYIRRDIEKRSQNYLLKMTLVCFALNGFIGNFFEIGALGTFSISPTLCALAYGMMCLHMRALDDSLRPAART